MGKPFNSLDAQREAAEAYMLSQRQEGWVVAPQTYNDGGFTAANKDRAALGRLMADIQAGRIDCVVVYKDDRLSRSLLGFARIMGTFDQHGVSFVSITQLFNTSLPVGRLKLIILLGLRSSKATLSENETRDKKSAARKKGKWIGASLPLGYDPRAGSVGDQPRESSWLGIRRNREKVYLQCDLPSGRLTEPTCAPCLEHLPSECLLRSTRKLDSAQDAAGLVKRALIYLPVQPVGKTNQPRNG